MDEEKKVDATVGGENPTAGAETKKDENKTISFEEMINSNKEYQSAYDKKVREAIETAKTNWEDLRNTEKSEAEKLAKMNKEQKLEYQAQKEKQEKENALAELNAYKMKEQATTIASDKGLEVSLLNLIDFKTVTAEKLAENIDNLSAVFNKAVEKAVNERLKEDTPVSKTGMAGSQPKPIPTVF